MVNLDQDDLTDALVAACLDCDAVKMANWIQKGADVNRPTHLGIFPVHLVLDPGNPGRDEDQARCLQLLLAHGVDIARKHRNVYAVCERISIFLPHCALAIIDHFKELPEDLEEFDPDHGQWWEDIFQQWKSSNEAMALDQETISPQSQVNPARL